MPLYLILFGIRATLKLGVAAREAYVTSTRNRSLLMPPLNEIPPSDWRDARIFFQRNEFFYLRTEKLEHYLHPDHEKISNIMDILTLRQSPVDVDKDACKELLIRFHQDCRTIKYLETGKPVPEDAELAPDLQGLNSNLTPEEVKALFMIGSWTRGGKKEDDWWPEVAETLFDIGLEFASINPKICNPKTSSGQALSSFLNGVQEADLTALQAKDIPELLFMSALEVLSSHPDAVFEDRVGRDLLEVTAKELSLDIQAQILNHPDQEETILEWGKLIFKSILGSGGQLALSKPSVYLGIKEDKYATAVSTIGKTVLDIAVTSENFKDYLNTTTLESITEAALLVVAKHPDLISNSSNNGLQNLIADMANDLAEMDALLCKKAAPEVMRLVLENSADNIELIWPDTEKDPKKHLLLQTAKKTLHVLSEKPADDASWKLEFYHDDATAIIEVVFAEIQQNPTWLTRGNDIVEAIIPLTLKQTLLVIRSKGENGITRTAARNILTAAVAATLTHSELLDSERFDETVQLFIVSCIELTLTKIFEVDDFTVKCHLTRNNGLDALLSVILRAAESVEPNNPEEKAIFHNRLSTSLTEIFSTIKSGKQIDFSKIEDMLT